MENNNEKVSNLAKAFLSLCSEEECVAFFADLFTAKELSELSARFEVAGLLKQGVNYIDIANRTGASTATISRVSKCLSGVGGGYRMALSRLSEKVTNDDSVIRIDTLNVDEAAAVRAIVSCLKSKA